MSQPKPRVAIDAHTIGRRATGNETYVRGLLSGLVERDDVDIVPLVDEGVKVPELLGGRERRLKTKGAAARLLGELPFAGSKWGADLLHVQYVRPPVSDVPCVTTIHDISYEHFPALFTRRTRLRMRLSIRWSARHSALVLTGSQHAREDLLSTYGLPEDRVEVTPYAADSSFRRLDSGSVRDRLDRLSLPADYLLCVGNLQPRKNLPRLLEAYARLPADVRPPMVVVGQAAWLYEEIHRSVRGLSLEGAVHFTGFVETEDLVALYNGAAVFAYPSLFEGFGLPVLEALACGTPTLTSDRSSLPEVAGDATILVDPESVEAIADGLERLLCDRELRTSLQVAGPAQAARFSWNRCGTMTADAYRRALGT